MINIGSILGSLAGEALGGNDNPLGKILAGLSSSWDTNRSESAILEAVMSAVQGNGGVANVLEMFNRNGAGDQSRSWVSNEPNQSIQPDQVEGALGSEVVGAIAAKLGVDRGLAGTIVAAVLPELINQLTPKGDVTGEQDDIISRGLSLLAKL